MHQWYHSGLEGYCKAASVVMGLPSNNSGWGNFGRDLFADGRFDDSAKASKTWVLSRYRGEGKSNRLKLFEESWLGRSGRDCELEAIHSCVHSMCAQGNDSTLYELYQGDPGSFAASFHDVIMPAIAEGFEAERYHPSDIECFAQGIDHVLGKLDPALPQTFRNFAIPLVAGLIYGPDHAAARTSAMSATLIGARAPLAKGLSSASIDTGEIVLTQLFSVDVGIVGFSGHYDSGRVVLLGRASVLDEYIDACGPELAELIDQADPIAFPVSHEHKSTSKAHGMIACIEGTWYYYDFSLNGSYVESLRQPSSVHRGAVALAPGDRIHLGLSVPPAAGPEPDDSTVTILVSFQLA